MANTYHAPQGNRRYQQERRLATYADDSSWVEGYHSQPLKGVQREAGETIGNALSLAVQIAKDKNLKEHKLTQEEE